MHFLSSQELDKHAHSPCSYPVQGSKSQAASVKMEKDIKRIGKGDSIPLYMCPGSIRQSPIESTTINPPVSLQNANHYKSNSFHLHQPCFHKENNPLVKTPKKFNTLDQKRKRRDSENFGTLERESEKGWMVGRPSMLLDG